MNGPILTLFGKLDFLLINLHNRDIFENRCEKNLIELELKIIYAFKKSSIFNILMIILITEN